MFSYDAVFEIKYLHSYDRKHWQSNNANKKLLTFKQNHKHDPNQKYNSY